MKNILCLIDALTLGGAERQLIGLASMLQKKGYHVDLAYYYKDNFYEKLASEEELNTFLIDVSNNRISKIWNIYKFVKRAHYDTVIAYKDGPNIIACVLKLFGLNFKLVVSERVTSQTVTLKDQIKYFIYRWADYVVPNSFSQRTFICKNFPILANKTVTITNFTDINHFTPSLVKRTDDGIRILTVARIAQQKNILNYLQAAKMILDEFPHSIFGWYGDVQPGEEKYEELCLETLQTLGISGNFKFFPAKQRILEVYHDYDVLCLPSVYEGFPNVVCEAMSCGKPILCSRVCDNPYIVDEGVNGLMFNPERVDDIYQVIKRYILLSDKEKIQMGKCSRMLAEQKFAEDKFVGRYIDLICS